MKSHAFPMSFTAYCLLPTPSCSSVSAVRSKFLADGGHGVSEDLESVSVLVGEFLALTGEDFLFSCPVGVIGEMVKGFGVGHEAEDAAGGIANAGHVLQGAVGVEGPLSIRQISLLVRVLRHNLIAFEDANDGDYLNKVFLADGETYGVYELYSAPIDGIEAANG